MYEEARRIYSSYGIDTEKALDVLSSIPISIHIWQGDDVSGFENPDSSLSGGIQATGNYPGKARTPEELMEDFEKAISLIPGKKRLNLHASYLISETRKDRNEIGPEDFEKWVEFAKRNSLGLDFNPTFFSHPNVKDNLTLSSPDKEIQEFWIEHGRRCRRIADYFGRELGSPALCNVWIPDGFKEVPADRLGPRKRLDYALDRIFEEKLDNVIDSVESKLFGIGVESFTVGSSEFYLGYCATHPGVYQLLDSGHFHPTEVVSDKMSSFLLRFDKLPLHVTRPVRWDSDHVVRLDDEIREIAKEIVRNDAAGKVILGLDFFDASVNRIAAWIVGTRSMQKALCMALLENNEEMRRMQDEADFSRLLAYSEEIKALPWQEVWNEWLRRNGLETGFSWYEDVMEYEKNVLLKRGE